MHIRHRPGIDVSQQDNREDAVDLINNAQLHYDSHYAAQTEWKQPLGVSTMTVQRLLGMVSRSWYRRRALLGIDSIAMTHPVFGGDTLYSESTVTALDAGADADVGIVSLTIEGINQRGETVSKIACRIELYRHGRHPEDEPGIEAAEEDRFRLYHVDANGALVEQTGLCFEDLAEGETFVHWPGRTIGFEESRLHALRSLEINPRWHDAAYLAQAPRDRAGRVRATRHRPSDGADHPHAWARCRQSRLDRHRAAASGQARRDRSMRNRPIGEAPRIAFTTDAGDRPGRDACTSWRPVNWCAAISARFWSIAEVRARTPPPATEPRIRSD